MEMAGLLYVLAAAALFLVVPIMFIAGSWKRLEPGVRRAMVILYLVVLGGAVLLYWAIDRWSSCAPAAACPSSARSPSPSIPSMRGRWWKLAQRRA